MNFCVVSILMKSWTESSNLANVDYSKFFSKRSSIHREHDSIHIKILCWHFLWSKNSSNKFHFHIKSLRTYSNIVSLILLVFNAISRTCECPNLSSMLFIETKEPVNSAIREIKAINIFFQSIQLNLPSPLSHLWTVSIIAGVRRPRLERKIAPLKLMKSSKSGKAAAMATEIYKRSIYT